MFEQDGKLIIEWKAGGDAVELEASGLSTDILSALATASGEEIRVFALPEKLDQNLDVFLNTVQAQARFGGSQPAGLKEGTLNEDVQVYQTGKANRLLLCGGCSGQWDVAWKWPCTVPGGQPPPLMEGRERVRTVLDIPEKAWEKIVLEEESYPGTTDVKGFDLSDCVQDEKQTKKVRVSASLDGKWTSCRRCDDGELVFYRDGLLAPIMDDIEDSDYITYTIRRTGSGQSCLAIHDGMNLLALIMPMEVLSDTYLAELAEFQALCTEQLWRDKAVASRRANPEGEGLGADAEQTEMEGQNENQ